MQKSQIREVVNSLGGAAVLAGKLEGGRGRKTLTRQAIYHWKRIPLEHVHRVVELSGGRYTLEQLRPDIYRSAA